MSNFSPEYVEHFKRGPFPHTIDPFAEEGRYFHAIHGGMIDALLDSIQDRLIAMGYQAGRETSLQIVSNRQPNIYVQQPKQKMPTQWDYDSLAASAEIEAGVMLADEALELDAIHISTQATGELITVVEIISPRNKSHAHDADAYQRQRTALFLRQGVNVVEIDCTRSVRRLVTNALTEEHPYHIAIHLPHDLPRVLVSDLLQPMKPFALPLNAEIIAVETQPAYNCAYQRAAIAGKIQQDHQYSLDELPFPSLIPDKQKQKFSEMTKAWEDELKRLAQES
jgi:hypothetical protein